MFTVYHFDYEALEKLSKKEKETQDYYVFKSLPIQTKITNELQDYFLGNLAEAILNNPINSENTSEVISEHLNRLRLIETFPKNENAQFGIKHGLYKKAAQIHTDSLSKASQALIDYFYNKKSKVVMDFYKPEARQSSIGDLIFSHEENQLYVWNNIGLSPLENQYFDILKAQTIENT